MEVVASMSAPCSPAELFAWVDDLARYPAWLDLVTRAEPQTGFDRESLAGGPAVEPAWSVELQARLGRLARSKRLRMVRTQHEPERLAVFERRELDGRQHAPWTLRVVVAPNPKGSELQMRLHYGGSLWGPVLERVLAHHVEAGSEQLLTLVTAP